MVGVAPSAPHALSYGYALTRSGMDSISVSLCCEEISGKAGGPAVQRSRNVDGGITVLWDPLRAIDGPQMFSTAACGIITVWLLD